MKLPLSSRLLACARFVSPGDRVADVGCDHGYLGIYLLTNGIASSVIASDVNEQPLQSALYNSRKYGVADRMTFFLSDGVRNIPRDFDTLVCAGMGADTMISILTAAPWLKSTQYRLILQCQSKTHELRRHLCENGWHITEEAVLRDGRFLYTVMEVRFCPDHAPLTPGQWYFPPAMLKNPSPETAEYCHRTVKNLRLAVSARGEKADPLLREILQELEMLAEDPRLTILKKEHEHGNRS